MDTRRKLWTEYNDLGFTTGVELRDAGMDTLLSANPDAVVDQTNYGSARVTLSNGTFYVNHWFIY